MKIRKRIGKNGSIITEEQLRRVKFRSEEIIRIIDKINMERGK